LQLQRGEQLQALRFRHAEIQLAVEDQRRRMEFLTKLEGDTSGILGLSHGVPPFSQRGNHSSRWRRFAGQIVDAIVTNQRLETVRVAQYQSIM